MKRLTVAKLEAIREPKVRKKKKMKAIDLKMTNMFLSVFMTDNKKRVDKILKNHYTLVMIRANYINGSLP